jgi:hypothetical protein
MYTQPFDVAPAPYAAPLVWNTLLRRVIERLRNVRAQYELDEHIARDVGVTSYTVPLFGLARQGGWR